MCDITQKSNRNECLKDAKEKSVHKTIDTTQLDSDWYFQSGILVWFHMLLLRNF